jgi:hypothetical protein
VRLPESILDPGAKAHHSPDALRTGRLLKGASTHAHRLGDDRQALDYAKLGLALAQDLGRDGPLIYPLVQFWCEGLCLSAMKYYFESYSLGGSELAALAAWLEGLDRSRPDVMEAWVAEDVLIRTSLAGADWSSFDSRYKGLPRPTWRCLYSRSITRAQALNLQSEFAADILRLRPLTSWERIAKAPSKGDHPTDNPLFEWTESIAGGVFRRDALTLLLRALLRVAVAAARYESEHGRFPSKIEDLVPGYLPALPVCPLTGLPLHAANGKVWSPGKNRVDDGGVEDKPEDMTEDGGSNGDVVWTVKRR